MWISLVMSKTRGRWWGRRKSLLAISLLEAEASSLQLFRFAYRMTAPSGKAEELSEYLMLTPGTGSTAKESFF